MGREGNGLLGARSEGIRIKIKKYQKTRTKDKKK